MLIDEVLEKIKKGEIDEGEVMKKKNRFLQENDF